ncbi:hypothetical protein HDK90DRAFT_166310 [Phyllosticta capitalensis]|uniref:Uncharacterized protein n=1 Tax=Phyllosticta capitalensis TaxID=121624 RepID=A0ABR1Z1F9_9PEZI
MASRSLPFLFCAALGKGIRSGCAAACRAVAQRSGRRGQIWRARAKPVVPVDRRKPIRCWLSAPSVSWVGDGRGEKSSGFVGVDFSYSYASSETIATVSDDNSALVSLSRFLSLVASFLFDGLASLTALQGSGNRRLCSRSRTLHVCNTCLPLVSHAVNRAIRPCRLHDHFHRASTWLLQRPHDAQNLHRCQVMAFLSVSHQGAVEFAFALATRQKLHLALKRVRNRQADVSELAYRASALCSTEHPSLQTS